MTQVVPVTVVETPEFLAATRKFMDENERAQLVDFMANNPVAGDLIPGTGGVRKLRWGLEGRGKRGGARVIYFFHSEKLPPFVCSLYAKNTQKDLSAAAKNELKKVTKSIVENYGKARK